MENLTLKELLESNIPAISETARRARQFATQYKNGFITKDEYEDLLKDLTNLKKIDSELFEIEVYRKIAIAFEYIATLKDFASFL